MPLASYVAEAERLKCQRGGEGPGAVARATRQDVVSAEDVKEKDEGRLERIHPWPFWHFRAFGAMPCRAMHVEQIWGICSVTGPALALYS